MLPNASDRPRCRIVEMVSAATTVETFLSGHLRYLKQRGHDVYVISSASERLTRTAQACGAQAIAVDISREMDPLRDLVALVRLCAIFRRIRPQLVNASTPKAGLLGMLAARITGVPARIYTLRGLRMETCRGWKRLLLSLTERIASACAHRVVAVSPSLGQVFIEAGFCKSEKLYDRIVSSHGVDSTRFAPRCGADEVVALRQQLGIDAAGPVIGFVGRLTRDKGIEDLLAAFQCVLRQCPSAQLLVVGDYEAGDPVPNDTRLTLEAHPQIFLTGNVRDASLYYNLMDVLAFPSYREGLPNAPLEAAASEIPTVGFAATGTVDAIVHAETGWLVPVGDIQGLANALLQYLDDPQLRARHGRSGRLRMMAEFDPEALFVHFERVYCELLESEELPKHPGSCRSAA